MKIIIKKHTIWQIDTYPYSAVVTVTWPTCWATEAIGGGAARCGALSLQLPALLVLLLEVLNDSGVTACTALCAQLFLAVTSP